MIKSRQSEDHLSKDMILSRIREIDIFSYYCPSFKELGVKFCSELRDDKSPSVSIIIWQNRLLYKDFGHPEHTFDCFSYIMKKYNCSFYDALRVVDNDFGLNLSSFKDTIGFSMGVPATRTTKKVEQKRVVIIRKRRRKWMRKDQEFWSQFFITKTTLIKFAVCPITHYWINENRFSCDLSYAYKIGKKYKIYSPYEDTKWISNTTRRHVQGYVQLPDRHDICVVTSSLKDVMSLYELGIPAIALQSEMQMPEKALVHELQERFGVIALFYDNDFDKVNNPGQTMANKIIREFPNFVNIVLPEQYGVKDLSDYIAKYQSTHLITALVLEVLIRETEKKKATEQESTERNSEDLQGDQVPF